MYIKLQETSHYQKMNDYNILHIYEYILMTIYYIDSTYA